MVTNIPLIIINVSLSVISKQQPKTVACQKALLFTLKLIDSNPENYAIGHWVNCLNWEKIKKKNRLLKIRVHKNFKEKIINLFNCISLRGCWKDLIQIFDIYMITVQSVIAS